MNCRGSLSSPLQRPPPFGRQPVRNVNGLGSAPGRSQACPEPCRRAARAPKGHVGAPAGPRGRKRSELGAVIYRLKKKLNCAGARADCRMRGGVGSAGRAAAGRPAPRVGEALGASWIDMWFLPRSESSARRRQAREPRRVGFGRRRQHRLQVRIAVLGQTRPIAQLRGRRPARCRCG